MVFLLNAYLVGFIAAPCLGLCVGVLTCKPGRTDRWTGALAWIVLPLAGALVVETLRFNIGRYGLWLETGLLLVAAYGLGCLAGCLARTMARAPDRSGLARAAALPAVDDAGQLESSGRMDVEAVEAPVKIAEEAEVAEEAPQLSTVAQGLTDSGDGPVLAAATTQLTSPGEAAPEASPAVKEEAREEPALATEMLTKADSVPLAATAAVLAPEASPAIESPPEKVAEKPQPKVIRDDRPQAAARPERAEDEDNLRLIQGIGPTIARILHYLGVWRFGQIAAWTPEQARWIGQKLGHPGRVEREGWTLQARLLEAGVETEYSRAYQSGDNAASVFDEPPRDEAEGAALRAALPEVVASLASDDLYAGKRPLALLEPVRGETCDLTRIAGLEPRIAERLNGLGVFSFGQIARWSPDNVKWMSSYLAFPGKIEREQWVEQARKLSGTPRHPPETKP